MKFINKIQKFMYGRYGVDNLYRFFFGWCVFLLILNMFIHSKIVDIVEIFIVSIMLYRFFSKNIYARRRENNVFLKIKNKMLKPFKNIKRNIKDKDHVYKRCRKCKKTLKLPLPSKRGIKHAKCPHCGKRVSFFTFKHEKIEFIK
ncbi:MAG: hypothetical protein IJO43_00830 [Bacilli bacterium]|nr:hypothetical protein [Bacilli bacterium]